MKELAIALSLLHFAAHGVQIARVQRGLDHAIPLRLLAHATVTGLALHWSLTHAERRPWPVGVDVSIPSRRKIVVTPSA